MLIQTCGLPADAPASYRRRNLISHLDKSPGLAPSSRHDLGLAFRGVQRLGKARLTFYPSGRIVDSLTNTLAVHGLLWIGLKRGLPGLGIDQKSNLVLLIPNDELDGLGFGV